jgi:hypothetical protein
MFDWLKVLRDERMEVARPEIIGIVFKQLEIVTSVNTTKYHTIQNIATRTTFFVLSQTDTTTIKI